MCARILLPALVLIGSAALAQSDDQFTPLFNGQNLDGWVLPSDPSLFTVENGEIVGRTQGDLKKNEFLVVDRPFSDFQLKASVKLSSGNSGIQFRSKRADDGVVSGPQADVAAQYWGLLYEEKGRGILERYPAEKAKEIVNADGWNQFEIIARGTHVQIFLNGTKVIDRDDPEFQPSGVIALQVHVGPPMEVRFKDLAIKPLD